MSESELMQRIENKLDQLIEAQKENARKFSEFERVNRAGTNQIRGEIKALSGRVDSLIGKIDALDGTVEKVEVAIIKAEISQLNVENHMNRLQQHVEGLTQLTKTNFDQQTSLLEHVTGSKGADRKTKPGGVGG